MPKTKREEIAALVTLLALLEGVFFDTRDIRRLPYKPALVSKVLKSLLDSNLLVKIHGRRSYILTDEFRETLEEGSSEEDPGQRDTPVPRSRRLLRRRYGRLGRARVRDLCQPDEGHVAATVSKSESRCALLSARAEDDRRRLLMLDSRALVQQNNAPGSSIRSPANPICLSATVALLSSSRGCLRALRSDCQMPLLRLCVLPREDGKPRGSLLVKAKELQEKAALGCACYNGHRQSCALSFQAATPPRPFLPELHTPSSPAIRRSL